MNIKPITLEDIDSLKELQPPDWDDIIPHIKYYIDSPLCDPIKITSKDKIIGIGTTLKHRDTAWLAHIIVHPEFRNKSIGKMITDSLVDSLDKSKYETIYLIATDLGHPVYLRSGFEVETEYVHFECEPGKFKSVISPDIIPFNEKYKQEIFLLDNLTTGEYRENRLNEHMQNSFIFLSNGKVSGAYFPTLREGLIIANDPDAGIELLKLHLSEKDESIFPLENKTAFDFLMQNNCKEYKTSRRMRFGKKRIWHPENLYNRVSGQIG
jgi:N-acetylglutamate synthase-like GNAT family acetyltransferase